MTKSKNTKRALLASILSMFICIAMFIGSTFAWFTDTASTSANKIVSGKLDVELVDEAGNSLEGKTLEWIKASDAPEDEAVLWEPGCTYELQPVYVKNNGNLALKFKIDINGVDGNAKLLEVIEFEYGLDANAEGHLKAGEKSQAITIKGHMKEEAGNEYQGLSMKGIGITVIATQDTVEYDSNDNQYDKNADYAASYSVNTKDIDDYLSSANSSMSNAKLILAPGNYDKLVIGAASPEAASDTVYTCSDGSSHSKTPFTTTDIEEFKDHLADGKWHTTPVYERTIDNLTIVGQEGVNINGLTITSGHMYSGYDPVLGKNGNYYFTQTLSNITFKDVSFTGKIDIATSREETVIDGVTFDECSFTTGGTASNNGQGVRFYNENNNGKVKNLTVTDCTFKDCYQGVYVANVNGVTVSGCTFENTGHNAIAIQSTTHGAVNYKAVKIENNKFNNINDRIIRFGEIGADTQLTIKGNTATNSGDDGNEVMKAQSLASGITYDISGNSWGDGKTVYNPELQDK